MKEFSEKLKDENIIFEGILRKEFHKVQDVVKVHMKRNLFLPFQGFQYV